VVVYLHLHCNLKYSEQPECAQHRQPKRSGLGLEVRPHDLEDGGEDDEAVEPVEGRHEVDPEAESPHAQKHLKDEEAEKDKLHNVWRKRRALLGAVFTCDFAYESAYDSMHDLQASQIRIQLLY
jgi:hypothetical protein